VLTQVWPLCLISISHARESCLWRITLNSVCSRFEFGYLSPVLLKKIFVLSKHGTNANIRSTKMANNRHAYDRDVLQSYWTSDGLPLYSLYPKEHPTNCPLRWRFSNRLGVYLSWLQAGSSHHTRQSNWWSVNQRRLATSCCPHFRQPPTSYKACVYGWPHQASSFKSSSRLPPKQNRDFSSLASHEHGFESHRAYLRHARPSYRGSGTSYAKHSSVGSSIASGMAAAITTGHPTSNWRDETQGWGRHPNTWVVHRYWSLNNKCRQVIHKWRLESEMTILSCFWTVKVNT
jgi:hypothetical protein